MASATRRPLLLNECFLKISVATGLRYKDKVTIVTGGSSGIGRGCVEVFVKHGAKVVFCSSVKEQEGKRIEEEINILGSGEATFIYCDVTKEKDVQNVINRTVEKYGRIDCLIYNAGRHPGFNAIDDISGDDFRSLLDTKVVSYFLFAKYALPFLRKTEANMINTASMVGQIAMEHAVGYVSSKEANIAFTKALTIDEAKYNVRVNCISPSHIRTPLFEALAYESSNPEETISNAASYQTMGRIGSPEECGLACLYLAADATFCTGININVSGGAELNYGRKTKMTS